MSDIKIQIKNYKLIKDYDKEFSNARLLLVTGKNEIGKSSLIRALIENMTATSQTTDPVSHGELSGTKTFTIPDKNGDPVTIVHEFSNSNKKGSFYAITHLGLKIKEVSKIREIIGVFEELSIDTFFNLQQTAQGRRKIIENYFYPLLKKEDVQEVIEIDKSTSKGGTLYDKRTETNQKIAYLESVADKNRPGEKDKVLVGEIDNISKELSNLENKKIELSQKALSESYVNNQISELNQKIEAFPKKLFEMQQAKLQNIEEKKQTIENLKAMILKAEQDIVETERAFKDDIDLLRQEEHSLREKMENLHDSKKTLKIDPDELKSLNEDVETLRNIQTTAYNLKAKIDSYEETIKDLKDFQLEAISLEHKIKELRERKKAILANSTLPSGLSINDDDFTWNGFSFNETQISKSSALLVIAEILCQVIESKIIYLGEKALFDKDRFKKLVAIAEKHGKIPVLEQVVDEQTELKVITEVEDV